MILLDSSLFQSDVNIRFPQIQNGRFEPPSSHILSGDIEGILTYLSNGRQSQCATGTSEFSSLSLLELRFFLSRPKSDLNVSFQLFRWLESYSQCNKKDQSFFYLFLCLFFLLHLAEEHLMTKEFVCTMKKILNGLQDHISGMKLEDFILHQVLSCKFCCETDILLKFMFQVYLFV